MTQHKKGTTALGIVFADIHCHYLAQHGLDLLTQNVPVVSGCIACSPSRTMVSQPPESKRYSLWGNADIKMTMFYVSLGKSHIREQVEKLNGIKLPQTTKGFSKNYTNVMLADSLRVVL